MSEEIKTGEAKRYFTPLFFRFIKRAAAIIVDLGFLLIFFKLLSLLFVFFFPGLLKVYSFLAFWLIVFYFPICHAVWGKTLGKNYLGLRVVDKKNFKPVANNVFMRMILRDIIGRLISHAVFGLGYLVALFTYNGEALHDIIAGTVVIEER